MTTSPVLEERGKRSGVVSVHHGSIRDSRPKAFLGGARGHRVIRETGSWRTLDGERTRNIAYRLLGYSPSNPSVHRTANHDRRGRPPHIGCAVFERSSRLRFQFLRIETHSFLPGGEGDGRDLASQGQARHFRPRPLGELALINSTERSRSNTARRGRRFEDIFQLVIVIGTKAAQGQGFTGSLQLGGDEAIFSADAGFQRQADIGPSIRSAAPSREIVLSVLVVRLYSVARFHHTSIRSRCVGTTMARSDSLSVCEGRPVAQSEFRSWLDQRLAYEHPGMRTSPTKLRVIDLVPQHDVKRDGQLARHRHLGRSHAFAKG